MEIYCPQVGSKKVILDASFVTSDSSRTQRLEMLVKAGCTLVMIDSLPYELCTSDNENRWQTAQRRLMPCADSLEVWSHTGELLRAEVRAKKATVSPIDHSVTEQTINWFRTGVTYVPDNLKDLTAKYFQQREVDSVNALISDCEQLKGKLNVLAKNIWNKSHTLTYDICHEFVNNPENIKITLHRNHGDDRCKDTFIPNASAMIDECWLAFHHAKSSLALLCLYVHKYGATATPTSISHIENTTIDSNYLVSVAFADAIATNETADDLQRLFIWMYGSTKKFISDKTLNSLSVTHDSIESRAFKRWEMGGASHGHDVADWLAAESDLYEELWNQL